MAIASTRTRQAMLDEVAWECAGGSGKARRSDAAAVDACPSPRRPRSIRPSAVQFADELEKLPDNQWSGPVPSSYGLHLVRVTERREGRNPVLSEVRDAVAREWSNAKRKALEAERIETLLKRYNVTIENTDKGETR